MSNATLNIGYCGIANVQITNKADAIIRKCVNNNCPNMKFARDNDDKSIVVLCAKTGVKLTEATVSKCNITTVPASKNFSGAQKRCW